MPKLVSKKEIPSKGDSVQCVKYNKDRTLGQICFESGKKVIFHMHIVESPTVKKESKQKGTKENIVEAAEISQSNNDEAYKFRAMDALHRLQKQAGVESGDDKAMVQAPTKATQQSAPPVALEYAQLVKPIPNFKELAAAAIARSEEVSKRIGDQLAPKTPMMPK